MYCGSAVWGALRLIEITRHRARSGNDDVHIRGLDVLCGDGFDQHECAITVHYAGSVRIALDLYGVDGLVAITLPHRHLRHHGVHWLHHCRYESVGTRYAQTQS